MGRLRAPQTLAEGRKREGFVALDCHPGTGTLGGGLSDSASLLSPRANLCVRLWVSVYVVCLCVRDSASVRRESPQKKKNKWR
jgi:hypothetical protein